MSERNQLGRGLGALIPSAPHESVVDLRSPQSSVHLPDAPRDAPAVYREVPIDAIRANPRQPRDVFDEEALAELTHSIREVGLLQPLVVRERQQDRGTGADAPLGEYELIAGERRWRACRAAGLQTVAVIVRTTPDEGLLTEALLENVHRAALNPLEEAAAYAQLLTDFSCTQEQLAQQIGRSRSQIANSIRLLRLPPTVQRRLAAGVLSAGHARALLGLSDAAEIEALAARIVAEGLSVRDVEELVAVGGSDQTPSSRSRRTRPVPPELQAVGDRLGDHLETRVKVSMGSRKGRISIDFGSVDDLARIVEVIEGRPLAMPTDEI